MGQYGGISSLHGRALPSCPPSAHAPAGSVPPPGRARTPRRLRAAPFHSQPSVLPIRPAFTLAELMVSVAVLLVLMAMVGWIFSTATRSSGIATASNELNNAARAAETQFGRDFGGLIKNSFIGIWYQLSEDPRYAGQTPKRYLRTDRIVFFTAGDHSSIRQLMGPGDPKTWSAELLTPPTNPTDLTLYRPIRGSVARVFLGHSLASDAGGPTPETDPTKWILTRRSRVLAPELNVPAVTMNAADAIAADQYEFERITLDEWRFALIGDYFGANGVDNWMRRPMVNTADGTGAHMLFIPGCAEFKVQRWIERDPLTGEALGPDSANGMPRWWPEDDRDGDGLANNGTSDFFLANPMINTSGNTIGICEYFNAPLPQPPTPPVWLPGDGTPFYLSGTRRWYCFTKDDIPKAIKVTIRLFDANKRIPDGQIFTMTFGIH